MSSPLRHAWFVMELSTGIICRDSFVAELKAAALHAGVTLEIVRDKGWLYDDLTVKVSGYENLVRRFRNMIVRWAAERERERKELFKQ